MHIIRVTTNIYALLLTVVEDISIFKSTLENVGIGAPHLEENEFISSAFLYTIHANKTKRLDAYTNCLQDSLDLFVHDTTLDLDQIFKRLPNENQVWTGIKYSTEVSKLITPFHDLVPTFTIKQSTITVPQTGSARDAFTLSFDGTNYAVVKADPELSLPYLCMTRLPDHFLPQGKETAYTTVSKLKMLAIAMENQGDILKRRFEYIKNADPILSPISNQVTLQYKQNTLAEDFPQLEQYITNDRYNGVDILNLNIAATTLQNRLNELSEVTELLFENPLLIKKIGDIKGIKFERPLLISQNPDGKIIIQLGQDIISQVQTDFFDISLADLSLFLLGTLGTIVAILKATLYNKPSTVYSIQALPGRQRDDLPYYVNEINVPPPQNPLRRCC